ncbi:hypothetical protein L2D14_04445 [Thalassospiraceae bacterium LMO-JJ14]|nr:hypothetical protein L2D14_04445 [Thalassospiraceae bacterium LMO-JJ14]
MAIRTKPARALMLIGALGLGLGIGLSGCAQKRSPANWQHPSLPREAWSDDIGECRRYARRETDREAGLPTASAPADNLGGGLSSYNSSISSYDLARFQERTFASCMRRLGYRPIVK